MNRPKSSLEIQQEAELPRLPVPDLAQTLGRFLRSAEPHLTAEELQTTRDLARDFGSPGGVGGRLQKFLEERAATRDNWLEEWWLHAAYLDYRQPLPVHSSTAMVFPAPAAGGQQLARAAAIMAGALDFTTKLYAGKFPAERMGPHVLDSWQYFNVVGTCRLPGNPHDSLRQFGPDQLARHVLVVHNKRFFHVPVYGAGGELLSQSQLVEQLTEVVAQSPRPSPTPVGLLTSEHRDTWARAYQQLRQGGPRSVDALEQIESALFAVCLDGEGPTAGPGGRMKQLGLMSMHGGVENAGNRWTEKCIQFVVDSEGGSGLAYEHSPADGHPVSIMMDYIEDFCSRSRTEVGAATFTRPRELLFDVPDTVRDALGAAQDNLRRLVENFELEAFTFSDYGKEFIKSQNMSPDSYIQMALQFTFYRLHGEPGAQYETALTRRFLHGRTETIRSCSLQSVAFARTMLDPATSPRDKAGALRAAIQAHKEYVVQAMSGEGVDRHLLGLRLAAAELGLDVPPLFLDAGYLRSGHMRLSTSQVNMRCLSFSFFGPVVPDGYGCCYNPHPHQIMFSASAFRSGPDTSAAEFTRSLRESLADMKTMLTSQ